MKKLLELETVAPRGGLGLRRFRQRRKKLKKQPMPKKIIRNRKKPSLKIAKVVYNVVLREALVINQQILKVSRRQLTW